LAYYYAEAAVCQSQASEDLESTIEELVDVEMVLYLAALKAAPETTTDVAAVALHWDSEGVLKGFKDDLEFVKELRGILSKKAVDIAAQ
jgi:hypothetical protein